jgi:hypothetical protein
MEQNSNTINQKYGTKPYKKTRYILKVMPHNAIVLVDLEQKPPKELKRFPPDQIEQAKREMVRLGNKDERAKKIKELKAN